MRRRFGEIETVVRSALTFDHYPTPAEFNTRRAL
jgi:hypothetical protein